MKPPLQDYLGDGLYASWDGYQICLKANDPEHPTDTVYLDPHVINSFMAFVKRVTLHDPEKN